MSAHKFNKDKFNKQAGANPPTSLSAERFDHLSPGSSRDHKARIVLGLVVWENAKGKRVCQQRVRHEKVRSR